MSAQPPSDGGHGPPPARGRPDIERGPHRDLSPRARRLVERSGATDRATAFAARIASVREEDARIRRRERALRVSGWSLLAVVLIGAGIAIRGSVGGLAGGGLLGVAWLLSAAMERAARRRGASAWDWRARRYRLLGAPAADVQALDDQTGERDALGQRKRST